MICTPTWLFVVVAAIVTALACLSALALAGYRAESCRRLVKFPSQRELSRLAERTANLLQAVAGNDEVRESNTYRTAVEALAEARRVLDVAKEGA